MKTLINNPVIEQFYIDEVLINPVNKIIETLKNGGYSDCDIKWLDTKLEKYMKFAAETLGVSGSAPSSISPGTYTILNDYVIDKYIAYFSSLLKYFQSF